MMRAELHVHTKLSDDVSIISVKEIMEQAQHYGLSAIAFTNRNNVQDFPAIVKAYRDLGEPNVKLIYGAELCYKTAQGGGPYGATVLVKNQEGVKALYKIISSIQQDGTADLAVLKKNRKHLLVGSCGDMGELYESVVNGKDIERVAAFYDYFELYPAKDETEKEAYKTICDLGDEWGVPVVASGNCHYFDKEDEICRRIVCTVNDEICRRIVCTVNGRRDDNKKLFLHTINEMLEEFSYLGEDMAYQTVVTNTNGIADMIEQISPIRDVSCPSMTEKAYEQVRELVYAKAKEGYGDVLPLPIAERLEAELNDIREGVGAAYYLMAYHVVNRMKGLRGYARVQGAGVSALVAFLLGLSDMNPMPAHFYCPHCHFSDFDLQNVSCPVCGNLLKTEGYHIPLEHNAGKMTDMDLLVPASRQHEVFAFLQGLLGENRVAQAGAVATINNRFAEGYIAVYQAWTGEWLADEQKKYICQKLWGVKCLGKEHSDRILVLPEGTELEDVTPLRGNAVCSPIKHVSHFDGYCLPDAVIKLRVRERFALELLQQLEDLTGKCLQDVPLNDPEIYALFGRGDVFGIPAFGADKTIELLLKEKTDCFADLVEIAELTHGSSKHMIPRARAVSYVMNAVRAAWYKIYYPVEFYAAFLSCYFYGNRPMDRDEALLFEEAMKECSAKGIAFLEPDMEKSHAGKYLPEEGKIRKPYVK